MDTPKRQHVGTWIPACLEADTKLNLQQEKLLAILNSLDDPQQGCTASNGYLAPYIKVGKGRVSKLVSSLADMGYISVTLIRDDNMKVEKRIIRVTYQPLIITRGIVQNNHRVSSETTIPYGSKELYPMVEKSQEIIKKDNKEYRREDKPAPAQNLIDPYNEPEFISFLRSPSNEVIIQRLKQTSKGKFELGPVVQNFRLYLVEQAEKFQATGTGLNPKAMTPKMITSRLQRWVNDQSNFQRTYSK